MVTFMELVAVEDCTLLLPGCKSLVMLVFMAFWKAQLGSPQDEYDL